jgi:hypothetical protein
VRIRPGWDIRPEIHAATPCVVSLLKPAEEFERHDLPGGLEMKHVSTVYQFQVMEMLHDVDAPHAGHAHSAS